MKRHTHSFKTFLNESMLPSMRLYVVYDDGEPVGITMHEYTAVEIADAIERHFHHTMDDDHDRFGEGPHPDHDLVQIEETTPKELLDMYGPEDLAAMLFDLSDLDDMQIDQILTDLGVDPKNI